MTRNPKSIDLEVLRIAINRIFDHMANEEELTHVDLDKDYYWSIDDEELYEVSRQPQNLGLGQLYDDWEFLEGMLKDGSECRPMLEHVSALLRYIATKLI